jgi:hypothetical protein
LEFAFELENARKQLQALKQGAGKRSGAQLSKNVEFSPLSSRVQLF